jgi:hypothetical protein
MVAGIGSGRPGVDAAEDVRTSSTSPSRTRRVMEISPSRSE